jgi:glucokinase
MTQDIVTVDIGGTHARFAIAQIDGPRCVALGEATTLKTKEFASFQTAWQEFRRQNGGKVPRQVAMSIAGPTGGDVIRFTNNPWIIRPALIREKLDVDHYCLVNDFEAVGHAVAQADSRYFESLCGPDNALPQQGTITVLGPGTGLGVAHVWRGEGGGYRVQATEGGHMDFAPLDSIEDAILARLRRRHRRVSVERVVSGPGLVDIYETLAALEGRAVPEEEDKALWTKGLDHSDSLASAAVDRFCLSLGAVAGDLALAQGAGGVVVAGGLGLRIRERLVNSGFPERFVAKGRFENFMSALPVKLITHPQPGLFGAAAAFAKQATSA